MKGMIFYYNLNQWWNNELSDSDKNVIFNNYCPIGMTKDDIYKEFFEAEEPGKRFNGKNFYNIKDYEFLSNILPWIKKYYDTGKKVAQKIEELIFNKDIDELISVHFTLTILMEFYYRHRSIDACLDKAMFLGYKDIEFSNIFAEEFMKRYNEIPQSASYEQIGIILEREKRYYEAIELCEKGKTQGWANDFDKRVNRIKAKINKI